MKILHALVFTLVFCPSVLTAGAPFSHLTTANDNPENFLIGKVARGETIIYCSYIAPNKAKNMTEAELDAQIRAALNLWLMGASEIIKEDKQDFSDITAILDTPVKLKKLPLCNVTGLSSPAEGFFDKQYFSNAPRPDISVIYHPDFCTKLLDGVKSSFFSEVPIPVICLNDFTNNSMRSDDANTPIPFLYSISTGKVFTKNSVSEALYKLYDSPRKESQNVLLHEFGHALALGDQYEGGQEHCDVLYASPENGKGIMSCQGPLNCDDVNGLITRLDRATGKKRVFESLCGDGLVYENGKPVLNTEIRKIVQYSHGKDHTGTVVYSITPQSRLNNIYIENRVDTYMLNNRIRAMLAQEINVKTYDINLNNNIQFQIKTTGQIKDNTKIGVWTRTIVIGPDTFVKTITFNQQGVAVNQRLRHYKERAPVLDPKAKFTLTYDSDKALNIYK